MPTKTKLPVHGASTPIPTGRIAAISVDQTAHVSVMLDGREIAQWIATDSEPRVLPSAIVVDMADQGCVIVSPPALVRFYRKAPKA